MRLLTADPDSPECAKRGVEEQLFDAIPARVRMALSYYAPLVGVPGVEFRLHRARAKDFHLPWQPSRQDARTGKHPTTGVTALGAAPHGVPHPGR